MHLFNLIKKSNIVFFIILFSTLLIIPSINISLDTEEETLLNLINEYRQNNGLSPLVLSSNLTIAAKLHSQDMANNNYFSHYSLDGRSPLDRAKEAGYFYLPIGENIAAGYTKAIDVFNAWKNSYEHNKNMLNKDFKAIGIGRAYNSSSFYKWYWTVDFGGGIPTQENATSTITITRTFTLIIYVISYISNYTTIKETITEKVTSYMTLNTTFNVILSTTTTKIINQTNVFSLTTFKTSFVPKTTIINLTNIESSTTTISKTNTILTTLIITTIEKIIEKPIIQFFIISILIIISILNLIFLRKK